MRVSNLQRRALPRGCRRLVGPRTVSGVGASTGGYCRSLLVGVVIPGKALILVAARERAIRLLVQAALRPAGLRVAQVDRSLPLPEDIADLRPDVIVLEDGELSARATHIPVSSDPANRVPVLVMTAVAAPGRSIQLLDAGADDVIGRPFDPIEFAARVRGLIRRRGQHLQAGTGAVGDALVDLDARMILRGGTSHSLTRPEWAMLARMMSRRGAIVSREELLTAAFGEAAHDDPALLRLTISRLRRKLGFDPWDEGAIRTVQGIRLRVRSGGGHPGIVVAGVARAAAPRGRRPEPRGGRSRGRLRGWRARTCLAPLGASRAGVTQLAECQLPRLVPARSTSRALGCPCRVGCVWRAG